MNKQQLIDLFDRLKLFSVTKSADEGITRLAFTQEDEAAHQFIMAQARELGLDVRQDAMGNIFARLEGKEPDLSAVATGSHLDSVPNGGAYDGVLGVLTALYAISQFKKKELKRSLELIIFRAEESSRFGFACMASKVMTGVAALDTWRNNSDKQGVNFFQAVEQCGYSSEKLESCILTKQQYSAFIETHIEQGAVLEKANREIGIVTGIAAPSRFKVEVIGQADHSGATPMDQRHDALVASANIVKALYYKAQEELKFGTVATVGKLDVYPNAMNVIPGRVQFFVDIRGVDVSSIDRVVNFLPEILRHSEQEFAVSIELKELGRDKPVLLDENLTAKLEHICQEKQINYQRIISGAGHDAMYMAKFFPTCMLFTPSYKGISHHPQEFTENQHIEIIADLLADVLKTFANQ